MVDSYFSAETVSHRAFGDLLEPRVNGYQMFDGAVTKEALRYLCGTDAIAGESERSQFLALALCNRCFRQLSTPTTCQRIFGDVSGSSGVFTIPH